MGNLKTILLALAVAAGGCSSMDSKQLARETIKNSDKNADGKLSVNELPFWLNKDRFNDMDANKDGQVDVDEMLKGFERMRGGRR